MMRLLLLLVFTLTSGCLSWFQKGTDPTAETTATKDAKPAVAAPAVPAESVNKELELKIAQLWAKVDELQSEVTRQKERTRLLHKGLVTGIIPNELGEDYDKQSPAPEPKKIAATPEAPAPVAHTPTPSAIPDPEDKQKLLDQELAKKTANPEAAVPAPKQDQRDSKQFEEAYAKAHALFSGEHWGQAIQAFAALGDKYSEELTQGQHLYWMGLSWFYLKEYQLAKKHFDQFTTKWPASPLAPKAGFYVAKADYQMGFVEKALDRYRSVIKDFPADDAAKMAKHEISKLEKAL